MNRKLHDIDRLFKTALGNEKESPSPKVWDVVRNTLAQKQAARIQRKYNRLKQEFIILLLLCTMAGSYALYHYATTHQSNVLSGATFTIPTPYSAMEHVPRTQNGTTQSEDAVTTIPKQKATGISNEAASVQTIDRLNVPDQSPVFETKGRAEQKRSSTEQIANHNFFKTTYNPKTYGNNARTQVERSLVNEHSTSWPPFPGTPVKHQASGILQINKNLFPIKREGILIVPSAIKEVYQSIAMKTRQSTPFSLTLFYAPDFSLDPLDDTDKDDVSGRDDAGKDRREQYASSYNAGLLLDYRLYKNWSLQTGIAFSNFSTTIEPKTIYTQANDQGTITYTLRCAAGNSYIVPKTIVPAGVGDSAQSLGSHTVLQYITVPLSMKYGVQKGKLRFITGFGLSANFLLEGKVNTNIQYGSDDETYENDISGLKPVYFNGLFDLGAEYRLTKKVWLGLMPAGRIALGSINKDIPVRSYQNFLSVAMGLRITF